MVEMADPPAPTPLLSHALDWRARLHDLVRGRSIQGRLVRNFSLAILVTAFVTTVVGVGMIRNRVFAQAQAQVNSDLEAAKEIYQATLDRLQDALRIHATRMVIYGALQRGDTTGLAEEMDRIQQAEGLDVLTLTDAGGRVLYRTGNAGRSGDAAPGDGVVQRALRDKTPTVATEVVSAAELAIEAPALVKRAEMVLAPTPRARARRNVQTAGGMMLKGAAPVFTPAGRHLGVLYGGVLLNRNYTIVDKVRRTVFKEEEYKGRPVGTATIFQDDVRISTNVRNADGTRAVATQASAEVADAVLDRGDTWRDRAFVVNDWYLSAYTPIVNLDGKTIGMLYVGVLERPYMDSLFRSLLVFVGIAAGGVALVHLMAFRVARRISVPIHDMAAAAQLVAEGNFSAKVAVASTDELGYLAQRFNAMTVELERAHQIMQEDAAELERKVEARTAELRAMQAHLIQSEKMAAIGKLSAGVAHEINNPLTGILTNSSLMLEDLADDHPWREDVQTIVNETLRCRKIVKGLLDFARQTKPQRTRLEMNQIVEDVLALVRNQTVFRAIAIEYDFEARLPAILADADQIRQVVLNIVLNAAEAMARGGTLRLSSRAAAGGQSVELRFADTGPGIPEDVKARVFEPFFTTKRTGTGLGLSIAYGIVERHHGQLRVESTPGGGTTFVIVLPVGGEEDDD
jgi:two-component system NtrC family sensor kinase